MSRGWTAVPIAALGIALHIHPAIARAQDLKFNDVYGVLGATGDLVFTPVVPCRIIDTRVAGGRMAPGAPRDFDVAGALTGQGGAANCGIPEGTTLAVALNFVAVAPGGIGNMRAWPFGTVAPTASLVNFTAGVTIANAAVIGICDPSAGACPKDFVARADASDIDLVVDVMGYFSSPSAGPGTIPWSSVTNKPAGFADDVDNNTVTSVLPGLLLNAGALSVDQTVYQRRVSIGCPAGQSIRAIDVLGATTCEPDDNTVTGIAANNGLLLSAGGTLGTDTATVLQRRVVGTCAAGSSIRTIDAAGAVACESDTDTTYLAGFGVNLAGTTFSADTAEMQRRVTTACPSGISSIDSVGGVVCAPRIQSGRELSPTLCNTESNVNFSAAFSLTPSVVLTAQGLAGTAIPPNSFCVVDEVTTTDFNYCCFGSLPDSVSWIAMVPTP